MPTLLVVVVLACVSEVVADEALVDEGELAVETAPRDLRANCISILAGRRYIGIRLFEMRPNGGRLSRSAACSRSSTRMVLSVLARASGKLPISSRIKAPSDLTAEVSRRSSCDIIRLPAEGVLAVINWPRARVDRNELASADAMAVDCSLLLTLERRLIA